jgi:[protein-PII] uridylyltransferase
MAFAPAENYIDVWLSTEDRPARFSQIAGVFAARGLSIISAQAYTRGDGIILDRFRVAATQHEQQQFNEKLCRELRRDFLGVFGGEMSLAEMLRSRQRRVVPGKRPFNNKSIPRIYVDNKSSPEYTIVDVVVTDRVGLLYNISLCLADCGLDIHFAKISTKLDQAIDVFYVADVVDVNKKRRTKVLEEDRIKEIKRALSRACVDKDLYEPKNKSDISG